MSFVRALLRLGFLLLVGYPLVAGAEQPLPLKRLPFSSALQQRPPTRRQAEKAVAAASRALGVNFRLDWGNPSRCIAYHRGQAVEVPRGLVQAPGMSLDGVSLVLAHEAGHAKGKRSELAADYWASHRGLAILWGEKTLNGRNQDRALLASYSALRALEPETPFDVTSRKRTVDLDATGYPVVQSRWNIYKAGVRGRPIPKVGSRMPEGKPTLMSLADAARYLDMTPRALAGWSRRKGGPVVINDLNGRWYLEDNLDTLRPAQGRNR
jgi:hypothetical protein